MADKRVLSVGQCAFDHGNIARTLSQHFQAEVIAAATAADAVAALQHSKVDLVLVNRIFDADGASGLDFIRLVSDGGTTKPPVMLVSNFEEYQQQAVALGAERGFGKAALADPETIQRLEPHLK